MDIKLLKILQIAAITAIATGGLSLLIPKIGFNLLTIKKPVSHSHQTGLSALAQAVNQSDTHTVNIPKAFQGAIVYQGQLKANEKVVALSFDDGPGPKNTAQVLEILKKNHIKATFFMIGEMVQYFPQIAKQVAADGHVIGNHTWHHWYRKMDLATATSEINRTADIIYKITGKKTNLFRPPGGFLHNGLTDYAKSQKYAVMMWSDESGDSERRIPQAPKLVKNVIKGIKPGAIVLMHDGGGNRSRSVAALPEIINDLKTQGYRFVTIPELLEIQAQEQNLITATSAVVTNHEQPIHQ